MSVTIPHTRPPNVKDLAENEYGFFIVALMYIKLGWYPASRGKKPDEEPALQNLRFEFDLSAHRSQCIIRRAEGAWEMLYRNHLLKRGGVCNVAKAA